MPYIGRSSNFGVRTRFLYTATASQTTFSGTDTQNLTLSYSDSNFIDVHQNGVLLKVVDDYTATSGTSVVLATGATASDVIEITVYDVFSIANHIKKTGDAMAGALTNIDIDGTELVLDADGDTSITADTDDQIDFRAGGTDVMALSTTGLTITNASNATQLTLKSTDDDANGGPLLDLTRDSASPADNDAMGSIRFRSDDDGGNETQFVDITGYAPDVSDGSEDGQLQIRTIVGGTLRNRLDLASGETVFNEDSVDLDFRVESNSLTHALFVEGSSSHVGIGSTPTTYPLEVFDTNGNAIAYKDTTNSVTNLLGAYNSVGLSGTITNHPYAFYANNAERMRVETSGDVTITDGNLVVASGHGIDFSSTSDAGGMANELLDDYEEGTWTPFFGGSSGDPTVSSYATANGKYTKIGNKVYANFVCIASGTPSGGSGDLLIAGLPYAMNATNTQPTGYLGIVNNITNNMSTSQLMLVGQSTSTNINVMNCAGTSTTGTNNLGVDKCHNSNARIDGTFIYTVTA